MRHLKNCTSFDLLSSHQEAERRDSTNLILPSLVLCLGLYRSSSTWTYNVVARLAESESERAVYADSADALALALSQTSAMLVPVKSHVPNAGLMLLVSAARIPVIINVRDPLDCVSSFMDQFKYDFEHARNAVAVSAASILETLNHCSPLVLRFEDEARGIDTVRKIGDFLKIELSEDDLETVVKEFYPDAIRHIIDNLSADGVFGKEEANYDVWDRKTHWHLNHVGQGLTGCCARLLSKTQIARVLYDTRAFRKTFSYAEIEERIKAKSTLTFAEDAVRYCENGFSITEVWGIWTDSEEASIVLPLTAEASQINLLVRGHFGAGLSPEAGGVMRVLINNHLFASLSAQVGTANLWLSGRLDVPSDTLHIRFCFSGLKSPADLGAEDGRLLGFGLSTIDLEYC